MCGESEPLVCASGGASSVPARMTGTTFGAGSSFESACSLEGFNSANDIAFEFTAPVDGTYRIDTVGSSYDTVLSVRESCSGEELNCHNDIMMGTNIQSELSVELSACETILIVVDGFGPGDAGEVVVNVSRREAQCTDGIDNDGDGLTDCQDMDCFSIECPGGDEWPPPWRELELEVLELTNMRRAAGASCGGEPFGPAPPLEMNEIIREAARKHSADMGAQGYFQHDSLDGRTFSDRMAAEGFAGPTPWGENIAAGQSTAEQVVQGWMDSPGHCRNIMMPEFRTIGVGYAFVGDSPAGHYWTQDFAAGH